MKVNIKFKVNPIKYFYAIMSFAKLKCEQESMGRHLQNT